MAMLIRGFLPSTARLDVATVDITHNLTYGAYSAWPEMQPGWMPPLPPQNSPDYFFKQLGNETLAVIKVVTTETSIGVLFKDGSSVYFVAEPKSGNDAVYSGTLMSPDLAIGRVLLENCELKNFEIGMTVRN